MIGTGFLHSPEKKKIKHKFIKNEFIKFLKIKTFIGLSKKIRGVLLPLDVNYRNLVKYVKKKYDITDKSVNLHYISGSKNVTLRDDGDVSFFVKEICCKQDIVQTLFIDVIEHTSEVTPSSSF